MSAAWLSIFVGSFVAIFISIISGNDKKAQDKAHARQIAEAKMYARLLRFNI
jgi:hypothetical protein